MTGEHSGLLLRWRYTLRTGAMGLAAATGALAPAHAQAPTAAVARTVATVGVAAADSV